jgi:hypothetical protein
MANYALDSDIYDVIKIEPSPSNAWEDELTLATRDVLAKIKTDFWRDRDISDFDEANLDTTALLQMTVYRALGWYICPSLEKYTAGEIGAWGMQAERFKGMYKDEWDIVQQLPIYDFDEDAVFEDTEIQPKVTRRTRRE